MICDSCLVEPTLRNLKSQFTTYESQVTNYSFTSHLSPITSHWLLSRGRIGGKSVQFAAKGFDGLRRRADALVVTNLGSLVYPEGE